MVPPSTGSVPRILVAEPGTSSKPRGTLTRLPEPAPKKTPPQAQDGVSEFVRHDRNGRTIVDLGGGNNRATVRQLQDGRLEITADGRRHLLSEQDSKRVTIRGGSGDDRISIRGDVKTDLKISGGRGDDTLRGGDGNDQLYGGKGRDRVIGGAGNDRLAGGRGDDYASGGAGDDWVAGGRGRDVVHGRDGNDRVIGGAGKDRKDGGPGRDHVSDEPSRQRGPRQLDPPGSSAAGGSDKQVA